MILPDLPELLALRGAAQGLSLHARRPALARLHGGHRSAQRGRGLEFEEVRLYVPGDDARSIDWRVTARRGKPHTKMFREDRERPVWLLADLHAGLFFGSKRQLKSALLLRTAAMLGWVATLGGDRLGAVVARGNIPPKILPPRSRQAGVLPVLQALIEAQPRTPGQPETGGLGNAVTTLLRLIQPGSLVLILSDFSGLDQKTQDLLTGLAMRCDCRLLWITDPLEAAGLPAGEYRAGLPDRLRWLDGDRSRKSWCAAWAEREKRLQHLARRLNLPLTRLETSNRVNEALPPLLREPAWAS
ncbi:MAG: DUF58 domain-containing protein [Stenotrophobium sp.]